MSKLNWSRAKRHDPVPEADIVERQDNQILQEAREFAERLKRKLPGTRATIPVKQNLRIETVILVGPDDTGRWCRLMVCKLDNHLERARGYVSRYNAC